MLRYFVLVLSIAWGAGTPIGFSQVKNFSPVTKEMLLNPSSDDWLMFSRTYDAQRFSPLRQINRQNVAQLRMAWTRGIDSGVMEHIPLVYQGVMYLVPPTGGVQALDATNGDLIWEYQRKFPDDMRNFVGTIARPKSLAIYQDMIFHTAHDGYVVALDARTGTMRWETKAMDYKIGSQHTAAPIIIDGKVITGRACQSATTRDGCFIAAHDAQTGKELWKFFTTAAPGEPGGDTWGNVPVEKRIAGPWGLPGSYDAVRNLLYWGVANPLPYTRLKRHEGNLDDVPRDSPADAYSNSTIALNPDTGKLVWYYQHLPGDDWDLDAVHERVLLRTRLDPDPASVKWISSQFSRGQERDVVVTVPESGGIWVNDRETGQFLWVTPFPYDTPDFHISNIDARTGKPSINWDRVLKENGDKAIVCFSNTKGYWPMAYDPGRNSLYIPYNDECVDQTASPDNRNGASPRGGVLRPGADPQKLGGIAKVNMATGKLERFYAGPMPSNGAVLATAGDLVFWGDMNRRFRAFDSDSGKILWESTLGSSIMSSTISYAVNGKQYIAVFTGEGQNWNIGRELVPQLKVPRMFNSINVFSLP